MSIYTRKYIFQFDEIEVEEYFDNIFKFRKSTNTIGRRNISKIINNQLHDLLAKYKNDIGYYYKNKLWDKYKKMANPYELIYNNNNFKNDNIYIYKSISRSFFKLWEILTDFELFKNHETLKPLKPLKALKALKPLKALCIADGPGGFIEAFLKYREEISHTTSDKVYGITLISKDNNVPKWKIPLHFYSKYDIELLSGKDGTGSIYNLDNIIHFVQYIGANSCDFLTADGGFDFSKNFNNQETQSFFLIMCEIYLALQLQKRDGVFILKVFDLNTIDTITLLYILHSVYSDVFITKPYTSRPANSEKYIICKKYKSTPKSILSKLKYSVKNNLNHVDIFVPTEFIEEIVFYNFHCVYLQIFNIHNIIRLIDSSDFRIRSTIYDKQLKFAEEYIKHYKVDVKN